MDKEQTQNQEDITGFICEELQRILPDDTTLSADTDMIADIAVDSVAIMDLVFALEERFDVAVPLNNLADIRTISDLANLVHGLQR